MTVRSDKAINGRYTQGGKADSTSTTIGWWERTIFPQSPLDVTLVITKKYAGRPDLIAYDMYGKSTMMWVVLQYNNVVDLQEDLTEGTTIRLPTKGRLFGELLGKSSSF